MPSSSDSPQSELGEQVDEQYERLRSQLEEYGESDLMEKEVPGETLADTDTEEYYRLSQEDARDLLSFYITTSAMIEQESALIINAYAFDFGMNGRGSLGFLQEDLTQKKREDMLYYLGIIDSGLKGEIARVRQRRNELAHSHRHHEVDDIKRVKNSIKRAQEAKNKLESIGVKVEMEMTGFSSDSSE